MEYARGCRTSGPRPVDLRYVAETVDPRKEYMMTLIVLSRIAVDACEPFLEEVPEGALYDSDHEWCVTEERDTLLEAMRLTITELRT